MSLQVGESIKTTQQPNAIVSNAIRNIMIKLRSICIHFIEPSCVATGVYGQVTPLPKSVGFSCSNYPSIFFMRNNDDNSGDVLTSLCSPC